MAIAIEQSGTYAEDLRDTIENTRNHIGVSEVYNITPEDHNGQDTNSMVIVEVKRGTFGLAD